MPINYSKWDTLELSDDSDIEVHPNVDKRSFIRAKQNQIHHERAQRKLETDKLHFEREVNEGLLRRIRALLESLRARQSETSTRNPAEVAFQAVMESSLANSQDDKPPKRPAGVVAADGEDMPTYTKMMASLLDQCNKALDEKKLDQKDRYQAMVEEIESHETKVQGLQTDITDRLAEIEKMDKGKITSESYKTGFDSSHVTKASAADKDKGKGKDDSKVELLNPNFGKESEGDKKAKDGDKDDDDEDISASPDARKFAQIKINAYRECQAFIQSHPHILSEKETDGLLVLAFDAALEGKDDLARQCVHQALLLQYCRSLGRDGVAMFFKRITTKGHTAQEVFFKDVTETFNRIRTRSRQIVAERAAAGKDGASTEEVEQIQLQAVEPGTVINIRTPPVVPETEQGEEADEARRARTVFEGFKPEMRKALESGNLDEVNKVLGAMKVTEAEDMVGLFSEAGVLSIEDELIDTTTEEGKKQFDELKKEQAAAAAATSSSTEPYADDPE